MNVLDQVINGVKLIEPDIFDDDRGYFLETYQKKNFNKNIGEYHFVQDNHSFSKRGVLRGLHFQKNNPQGKLVRVVYGEVFDVIVDIRPSSPTFGKWLGFFLSDKNSKLLWVPPGLAHGFLTISEEAHFVYKCTDYYDPLDEGCILWNDPDIKVNWPLPDHKLTISKKDKTGDSFKKFKEYYFK